MGWIPVIAVCVLMFTTQNVFVYGSSYSVLLLGIDDTVNTNVEYQFAITNTDPANADVKIEGADVPAQVLSVPSGEMKEHTLYQLNSMNSSGISNKSIHVTSTARFNLQVFYKRGSDYVEGFLAIPEENLLGPRKIQDAYAYVVTTFCATGGFCQFGIATFKDASNIHVKFPDTVDEIVFCQDTGYYRSNRDTTIGLQKYESIMFESASDLTGTYIYSFEPIAVFVGTRNISQDGVIGHMVEQLHPMSHWGTEYVVRPLGENGYGDILKISTQWNNTLIKMKGFKDFVVTNKDHNVWRRLDKGMSSHVKASKPIQLVQVTGLAYGSVSDTPKPGMVVVPAIENGEEWFAGSCGSGESGDFHVVSDLYLGSPTTSVDSSPTMVDNAVEYTLYRVENITVSSHPDDVYNISNPNKLRGIVTCKETAVMALGLVHQDPIPTSAAASSNEVLCRELVQGTTNFDPRMSQNARHQVLFDPYKIMFLRIRTCGTFFIQFLQDLNAIGNHVLLSITRKKMFIRKCEPECEAATSFDISSYNGDFDCTADMQMFWFSIAESGKLCYGFGPVAKRTGGSDCVTGLTEPITRALMTATPGKATFNYDLETEEECDYRQSEWRCEDKNDICATYGTDICTDHASYARLNCPKLCQVCSPDNYGRKFMAVIPKLIMFTGGKHFMYVSGYRKMPNIAVGTSTALIKSVGDLSDDITKVYDVAGLEDTQIFVFSDADVSVTILFGLTNIASYPVYPVDNFGTEYFLFYKDDMSAHCYFITEYSSIGVTQFKNKIAPKKDRETFQVGLSITLSQHYSTLPYQPPGYFTSTKPFIIYCGRRLEGPFHQLLPTNTWGTQYYVPAFETNPSDFPFDISLFIMAGKDNTVVTIDGDFNAIHALSFSGDTEDQPITGSETYTVTATNPIGLGVVFSDDGTPAKTRYFHALPPSNGFLSTQVSTVPVGVLSQFDAFDDQIGSIKSYHVDGQPTSIQTDHTVPDTKFMRNVTTSNMYGIYVVQGGAGQYFSLSGQRKNVNYETSAYCHTSLPKEGDTIDNDCDGLSDEDTCCSGYGVYCEDYDLDGAFSDDCCCTDSTTSILGKPTEPACLEIQKPANQCWAICQCNCEWLTSLENYQKLTESEKEALHAAIAESQKKALVLDEDTLSASTSQKISAEDDRASAVSIGYVGIALFTIVFGTIFIMDINSLIRDVLITCSNMKEGAGRLWNFVRGH